MAIYDRVCRQCGLTFKGGPRAWYCPACRAERDRKRSNEFLKKKKLGNVRPLGSTDKCERCGAEYIVNSGLQKYCPTCAPIALKELDNQQSREYIKAHPEKAKEWKKRELEAQKEFRRLYPVTHYCQVCGEEYVATGNGKYCSDACREYARAMNNKKKNQKKKQAGE